MYVFRRRSLISSDLIRQALVFTHSKPILPAVGSAGLQGQMQLLDQTFRQLLLSALNDGVDASEMVRGLDDIIHTDAFTLYADGVRLEYIAGLVVGKAAALDMV